VMVAHGTPCLGPVTQFGCRALCPSYNRGCYGCFGPMENPNPAVLSRQFKEMGISNNDIMLMFRGFNAYAEAFRKESEAHEHTK
jgi:sulfhydrogenase subunit delta